MYTLFMSRKRRVTYKHLPPLPLVKTARTLVLVRTREAKIKYHFLQMWDSVLATPISQVDTGLSESLLPFFLQDHWDSQKVCIQEGLKISSSRVAVVS